MKIKNWLKESHQIISDAKCEQTFLFVNFKTDFSSPSDGSCVQLNRSFVERVGVGNGNGVNETETREREREMANTCLRVFVFVRACEADNEKE